MTPTSETAEHVEYVHGGVTYRIAKTDPPTLIVVADYAHADFADRPQTWEALNAFVMAQEIVA